MSYKHRHIRSKIKRIGSKRLIKRPLFWVLVVIGIIVVAWIYFLLFGNWFQVSDIKISGNEKIATEEIEKIARLGVDKKLLTTGFFTIESKSIFIINKNTLMQYIKKAFPSIKNIDIQKKYPNSISVTIEERKPVATFCQDDNDTQCFLIDQQGVVFEPLMALPTTKMIIRQAQQKTLLSLTDSAVTQATMEAILAIEKNLENNFQLGVKEVWVSNPLIIITSEGWPMYFNPDSDMNIQITKMNSILKDEIPLEERKKIEYIYLQYKDKAYYK